jgi:hypothetical protein
MKLRLNSAAPRLIDPAAVGDALAAAHDRRAGIVVTLHPDDLPLMGRRFTARLIPG